MTHPLDGARTRLERAEKHARELQDGISEFLQTQPHELFLERDPEGTDDPVGIRVKMRVQPPLLWWGAVIGDTIHNLRAALDYVVWELSIRHSGPPPEPITPAWRQVQFPIYESKAAYESPNGRDRLLRFVAPELLAKVERLQPYHAGDNASSTPLAILQSLWNIDKHRTVPVIGAVAATLPTWHLMAGKGRIEMLAEWMPLEDNAEVARVVFTEIPEGMQPRVNMHFTSAFDIQFGTGSAVEGFGVRQVLFALNGICGSIVDGLAEHLE